MLIADGLSAPAIGARLHLEPGRRSRATCARSTRSSASPTAPRPSPRRCAGGCSIERGCLPRVARGRAVRDRQRLGRGLGARARRPGLQGPGDHQLWLRLHARAHRRRREPRRGDRAHCCARGGHRAAAVGRPRGRLRPRARRRGARDRARGRGRRGRRLDRGLRPGAGRLYEAGEAAERVAGRGAGGERRLRASPPAPRTTSAATTTSTTRSRACRPTSARAPTCSTRPACARPRRSPRCTPPSAGRSTCWRCPGWCCPTSSPPARSASASAAGSRGRPSTAWWPRRASSRPEPSQRAIAPPSELKGWLSG